MLQIKCKLSRSCWCARAGHQMSVCRAHGLLLVPCAPMPIVCLLPSCYLIIITRWEEGKIHSLLHLRPRLISLFTHPDRTDQPRTTDTRRINRETNKGKEGDTGGATETMMRKQDGRRQTIDMGAHGPNNKQQAM